LTIARNAVDRRNTEFEKEVLLAAWIGIEEEKMLVWERILVHLTSNEMKTRRRTMRRTMRRMRMMTRRRRMRRMKTRVLKTLKMFAWDRLMSLMMKTMTMIMGSTMQGHWICMIEWTWIATKDAMVF
jgi:hypothetical protein